MSLEKLFFVCTHEKGLCVCVCLTKQVVHHGFRFPVWLSSTTVAPESKIFEHPSHARHFLCHLAALGPGISSCTETMRWLHPGQSRTTPKRGNGRPRELIKLEGLMEPCAGDTGFSEEGMVGEIVCGTIFICFEMFLRLLHV